MTVLNTKRSTSSLHSIAEDRQPTPPPLPPQPSTAPSTNPSSRRPSVWTTASTNDLGSSSRHSYSSQYASSSSNWTPSSVWDSQFDHRQRPVVAAVHQPGVTVGSTKATGGGDGIKDRHRRREAWAATRDSVASSIFTSDTDYDSFPAPPSNPQSQDHQLDKLSHDLSFPLSLPLRRAATTPPPSFSGYSLSTPPKLGLGLIPDGAALHDPVDGEESPFDASSIDPSSSSAVGEQGRVSPTTVAVSTSDGVVLEKSTLERQLQPAKKDEEQGRKKIVDWSVTRCELVQLDIPPDTTHLILPDCDTPLTLSRLLHHHLPILSATLAVLDLSSSNLARLPPPIACLRNLEELDVSGNRLEGCVLPPFLVGLENLRVLAADGCDLYDLPHPLVLAASYPLPNPSLPPSSSTAGTTTGGGRGCERLAHLSLRNNQLSFLPTWLCRLDRLERLHVDGNPFRQPWKGLVEPILLSPPTPPSFATPPTTAAASFRGQVEWPQSNSGALPPLLPPQPTFSSVSRSVPTTPDSIRGPNGFRLDSVSGPEAFARSVRMQEGMGAMGTTVGMRPAVLRKMRSMNDVQHGQVRQRMREPTLPTLDGVMESETGIRFGRERVYSNVGAGGVGAGAGLMSVNEVSARRTPTSTPSSSPAVAEQTRGKRSVSHSTFPTPAPSSSSKTFQSENDLAAIAATGERGGEKAGKRKPSLFKKTTMGLGKLLIKDGASRTRAVSVTPMSLPPSPTSPTNPAKAGREVGEGGFEAFEGATVKRSKTGLIVDGSAADVDVTASPPTSSESRTASAGEQTGAKKKKEGRRSVVDARNGLRSIMMYLRDVHDLVHHPSPTVTPSQLPTPYSTPLATPLATARIGTEGKSFIDLGDSSTDDEPVVVEGKKDDRERRRKVLEEIESTERTYIRSLRELSSIYIGPAKEKRGGGGATGSAKEKEKKEKEVVPSAERRAVFSNVEAIEEFHVGVLYPDIRRALDPILQDPDSESPKEAAEEGDDGEKTTRAAEDLARVFIKHAAFLKLYATYITNFDLALDRLKEWTAVASIPAFSPGLPSTPTPGSGPTSPSLGAVAGASLASPAINPLVSPKLLIGGGGGGGATLSSGQKKRLAAYLKRSRAHPDHGQINLESYLLLPVQRLPRYKLLLETLESSMPPRALRATGGGDVARAVEVVRAITSEMNERKRDSEGRQRLLYWQARLGNGYKSPLVQPHRSLEKEGTLTLVRTVRLSAHGPGSDRFSTLVADSDSMDVTALLCTDLVVLCKDPGDESMPVKLHQTLRISPSRPAPASVFGRDGSMIRYCDQRMIVYLRCPSARIAHEWESAINARASPRLPLSSSFVAGPTPR